MAAALSANVIAAAAPSLTAHGTTPVPAPTAAAMPPYNQTVTGRILPMSRELLVRLAQEGRALQLDGVPVFNGDDKFLPGKIALGLAEFLVTVPAEDSRRAEYIASFRRISRLTVDDPNDSWGIYYYMSALNQLRKAGLLGGAVDRLTLRNCGCAWTGAASWMLTTSPS